MVRPILNIIYYIDIDEIYKTWKFYVSIFFRLGTKSKLKWSPVKRRVPRVFRTNIKRIPDKIEQGLKSNFSG